MGFWSEGRRVYAFGKLRVIPLGSLGLGGGAFLYAGEKRCKEFLSVSWWYFVGRRPARRAGRRQNLSPFRRFLIANRITSPHSLHSLSPLLKGGEGRGEGGSYTHVPCLFGALLVLYHFEAKAFLM
jgi:hypothetical protein